VDIIMITEELLWSCFKLCNKETLRIQILVACDPACYYEHGQRARVSIAVCYIPRKKMTHPSVN
jgi:hypothetical protein